MEYEQQPENPNEGFLEKVKNSPRTVSAVIIVLIVASAIYAFSGNNQNTTNPDEQESVATEETASASPEVSPEATAMESGEKASPEATKAVTPTPAPVAAVDKGALVDASKALPAEKKTDSAYVETAQKGDGLTHLARRASTRYLAEREAGYTITNEHRIYIEDYVRKHMPKERVAIGAEKTISFDLIKEAVDAAGKLTPQQLNHLTKYTSALK